MSFRRHLEYQTVSAISSVALLALLCLPNQLTAQGTDTVSTAQARRRGDSTRTAQLPVVRVLGRADNLIGVAQSAAQGRIGRADLRTRPMSREGEVLENVPGMILTQHSGDGKANQMFVRGMNLDHGTDFQTRIESMPINMPTHAHGQGYSYLNLLIPELVDHLEYKLGPYYAELGDFGAAGGATLSLTRTLSAPILVAETGAWGFARTVVAGGAQRGNHAFVLGGEGKAYDGPWERAQRLRKGSAMGRWTWQSPRSAFSVLALGYTSQWNASDQIPRRLITAGTLSRFGQVDPSLGGRTDRQSLSASWQRQLSNGSLRVDAYAIRYAFNLFSNFTYFLNDPAQGDQIEQADRRTVSGLDAEYLVHVRALATAHAVRVGLQGRFDDAQVALYGSAARQRSRTVRADDVVQSSIGPWTSIESRWTTRFRSILGLRADGYVFDVASDRPENSGSRTAAIVSPKASLVYEPFRNTELYVGGGFGFHSNDARGTTIAVDPATGDPVGRVDPLVRSRGGEVGIRTAPSARLRASASLWTLNLASELLFVGDAGTTEPQGRSRRTGVTVSSFWTPIPSLTLDTDVSFTRARFVDEPIEARAVTGALENVIATGLTWTPPSQRYTASLRLRHLGAYPLNESNAVRSTPTSLVNASFGRRVKRALISASVFNVLGSTASDIQYLYASRVPGEGSSGVDDVHAHPVEPRQLRLSVSFNR